MYNETIENLISAALADGVLSEKEKQILFKKAQSMGIDLDEFEMVLEARLVELRKAEKDKAASAAPKSNKYGDVRKCPVCGAIVQSYQAICPECGFEFSNVDANLSSQKLADEVKKASTISAKLECINLFPIPNTKADLLEFLTSLQPKMRDLNDPLSTAYFKKYEECIAKAQLSFANDPLIKPFIESFNTEKKALKKSQTWNTIKLWVVSHKKLSITAAVILVIVICTTVSSITTALTKSVENDPQMCNDAVTLALKENNIEAAENYVNNYVEYASEIKESYLALCSAYLAAENLDNAISLVEKYKQRESKSLQLNALVYKYMLNSEMYDRAENYIPYTSQSYHEKDEIYYTYIKDCVESMCEKGRQLQAKKFLKRKVVFFSNNYNGHDYCVQKVTKNITEIIQSY